MLYEVITVFDKPAKLIVAETEAKIARLQKELEDTKSAFAAPGATIASLEAQLTESKAAAATSASP